MNHVVKQMQKGFTLIELMLAMAFISALLLAIALTILQVGTIYNRGMTLKEVNQASRSVSDDITRSMAGSQAFSLSNKYLTTSAGGRLCLGQNTYIWNLGKAFANTALGTANDQNLVSYDTPAGKAPIRFIKIADPAGLYCVKGPDGILPLYKNIRAIDTNAPIEMLKSGDRTLTMHQFKVESGANGYDSATGQQLYNVTFTIGTGDASALTTDRTACLPPGTPNSDFSYCTVQQFSLVTRAGNRVN